MKRIVISILILGLNSSSAVLAIEDTGTNIWNGVAHSIYQLDDIDREKLKEYKKLYNYYLSINDNEKADVYLEKINTMLNEIRIW